MKIQEIVLSQVWAVPPGAIVHINDIRRGAYRCHNHLLSYKQTRDALYRLRQRHAIEHVGRGWYEWIY